MPFENSFGVNPPFTGVQSCFDNVEPLLLENTPDETTDCFIVIYQQYRGRDFRRMPWSCTDPNAAPALRQQDPST